MTNIGENLKIKKQMKFLFELADIIVFLIFVIWIMLFVRVFIFTSYSVVWLSMYPTFDDWDFIIVDKLSTKLDNLKRWDVLVFVPEWKKIPYIKRIIGLPWETVKLENWKVEICNQTQQNCKILQEPYLPQNTKTTAKCWKNIFKISSWYFVLGDNRDNSTDSRCCFGYWCYSWSTYIVRHKDMLWKVRIRLFPKFSNDFWHPTLK